MNCRLCLNIANDLFEIFGDEGKALKVSEIVTKHFWFQVKKKKKLDRKKNQSNLYKNYILELISCKVFLFNLYIFPSLQVTPNDPFSQHICQNCWANVSDFHDFYCAIDKKHTNCPPFVDSLGDERHPFETNFLISDKDDQDVVIQDASVNANCEVKTEEHDDFNFDFDGDEVVSAIKAETELKMSEEDLDDEYDDDYMGSDDEIDNDDTEDEKFVVPKPVKKKVIRSRKIKTETVTIKKEKIVRVKDAATQEKLKAIADKCKKSNEWGDAQEENIKQLCNSKNGWI
jgi:hypothetical protein